MKELEQTLKWIALTAVFALPFVSLIVADGVHFPYNFFFPFITGKNFAFRLIVEIASGAYLALALISPKYRPRRSWVLGALAFFVLVMAIADAQGAVPFKSFWSNFERMDGWITLIHLLLYVTVASALITTEKVWKRIFLVNFGVSAYLSLYGLLQIVGIAALGMPGQGGLSARIDATFGNPIYFAVYMLFNIFIGALLLSRSLSERSAGARMAPLLGYGSIIVLDTFALLFTGTRGTTLGLIGGTLLALVIYAFLEGGKRIRVIAVGSVVGIVILAGALYSARTTDFVKHIGFLDRLATIGASDDETMKARFINWSIAWNGTMERPIFGWGQENYAIVFDKYYDPRMYGQEQWFDRVHNVIFDWLVAGGIIGLLSYLSIFAATLWALWRPSGERRPSGGRGSTEASRLNVGSTEHSSANVRRTVFTRAEQSILTGLLAGYFVHNFFVFDNVTSYILFGTILSYIIWRVSKDASPIVEREFLPRGALPYVAIVCVLLTWGSAWYANAAAFQANRSLIAAINFGAQGVSVESHLEYFKQAITPRTLGTQEAREQLAQAAFLIIRQTSVSAALKQTYLETAANEMYAQGQLSPLDARFPLFLGMILDAGGDYENAKAALEEAHALSPQKQSILTELAQNAIYRGDAPVVLAYLKQAYELDTENNSALFSYAAGAIRFGEDALARQILGDLIAKGDAADQRILAAYIQRGNPAGAIPIWSAHVRAYPDDVQGYFTLAALYYKAGQIGNAIATLEQVKQRVPSQAAQADAIIADIRAGKPLP